MLVRLFVAAGEPQKPVIGIAFLIYRYCDDISPF